MISVILFAILSAVSSSAFHNKDGKPVLMRMVSGIKENKDYLGEIDGLIGDGDHGMNMNKGFSLFQQRFEKEIFFNSTDHPHQNRLSILVMKRFHPFSFIGDGDHGMNMNKGFSLFQQRFEKETFDLSEGLRPFSFPFCFNPTVLTGISRSSFNSSSSFINVSVAPIISNDVK